MLAPGLPTLDQLRVLAAVAETGSFSAAARRLNRQQSVVSYAIANLEAQLGLTLFDRRRKRPALTEAGRAVLADARQVAMKVEELRARAASLAGGIEAQVSLAVDVMVPSAMLVGVLRDFAAKFPSVAFQLRIEALGAVAQAVLDGVCDLGLGGPWPRRSDALVRQKLGELELVPVAAPGHPLAGQAGPIPTAALREHTQLVLTDRSELSRGQDFAVYAVRDWRLSDLGAKHALLRAGLGWGNMPMHMVAEDLRAGRLVRLPLQEMPRDLYPMFLMHAADRPPGIAGDWLVQTLIAAHNAARPTDHDD